MEGRSTRKEFWYISILIWIASFWLNLIFWALSNHINENPIFQIIWLVLFYTSCFALFLGSINNCVKRLHDLWYSWWYYFLLFVPIVQLYYCFKIYFIKWEEKDNKYWPNPYYKPIEWVEVIEEEKED